MLGFEGSDQIFIVHCSQDITHNRCMDVMSTGLQGARSRTRRAWVIEAEDGGGVMSVRGACGIRQQRVVRKDCGL